MFVKLNLFDKFNGLLKNVKLILFVEVGVY